MKFSKYFAYINNEYTSFPKLNKFMFSQMMNIVSLENRIEEVKLLAQKTEDFEIKAFLFREEILLRERFKRETLDSTPEQVFQDLLEGKIVDRSKKS